jgi:Tfp pilus assembly protein PilX
MDTEEGKLPVISISETYSYLLKKKGGMADMKREILENEKGIALVVALLMLLVLTLIGISSMNTAIFENLLSGNGRTGVDAFYSSEAGIQAGLEQLPITNPIPPTRVGEESYYWSGTPMDRQAPQSLLSFGLHQRAGFDSAWSFQRFQVNTTGQSFQAMKEIEVQVSYGPFPTNTQYNN